MNTEVPKEQCIQQMVNTLLDHLHALSEAQEQVDLACRKIEDKKLEDNIEMEEQDRCETNDESDETFQKKVTLWEMMQNKLEVKLLEYENFLIDINDLKAFLQEWEEDLKELLGDTHKKDTEPNPIMIYLKNKMLIDVYEEVEKVAEERVRKLKLFNDIEVKLFNILKEIKEIECELADILEDIKESEGLLKREKK